jgi:septal ring factor EnvC (AmiA/AmiB activator)
MSHDSIKDGAPVALSAASGFELGRRHRALRASVSEDDQSVSKIEQEIKKRVGLLDRSAAIIKGTPRLAAVFAPHTAAIEAQIADLERQAAEIRTASTAKRKEMEDLNAQLVDHRRARFMRPKVSQANSTRFCPITFNSLAFQKKEDECQFLS